MYNMKIESDELKDFCTPKPMKPEYPYGLKLHLGSSELKKLGMLNIPKLDEDFMMLAKCCVVEVRKGEDGEPSLCLQIEEMKLKSTKEESDSAEKVIYGN